jgi:hypothetical protein
MRRCLAALSIVVLAVACWSARGETPPQHREGTPEAAAAAVITATTRLDWDAYAALMDADSLQRFRNAMAPLLEATASKPAEQQAAVLALFDGAKDVRTALKWGPREFFARFMKGVTAQGPLHDTFTATKTKVLGTVLEQPDQAHVVIRATRTAGPAKLEKMDVLTFRNTKEGWKAQVPTELQSLGETLKLSFGNVQSESATATDSAEPEK